MMHGQTKIKFIYAVLYVYMHRCEQYGGEERVCESRTHFSTHHRNLIINLENCAFRWFVLYNIQTAYIYA